MHIIQTTLTVSGDVNGTVVLTSSVAPEQRLLVGQRQVANVTAFGFPVSADTTMLLQSLSPS